VISNTHLTVVTARCDELAVGPVVYSLIQNDTDVVAYFVIVPGTGELRLKDGIPGAAVVNKTYNLFVVASLQDQPNVQSVAALNVTIGGPFSLAQPLSSMRRWLASTRQRRL
jgi:hypothetical protein